MRLAVAAFLLSALAAAPAGAQQPSPALTPQAPADASPVPPQPTPATHFSSYEIIDAGHHFSGGISRELSLIRESGEPVGASERLYSRRRSERRFYRRPALW
jgi:hypothetical protein